MRIAILQLYCGQSGKNGYYNNQLLGLAKAYAEKEHEIFVVFPDNTIRNIEKDSYSKKIEILRVPAKTIGVHSFYDLKFLLDYKIDLVHLNSDNQAYAPEVISFCKKNQIRQYNYVGTLYSDSENKIKQSLMNIFSLRDIRYYKKSKTFAKTDYVMEQLRKKRVMEAKVVPVGLDFDVIPQITDTKEVCREKLQLPTDKKILLYVGRLAEYKKPLDALKVIGKLSDEYFLVVIGAGELKQEFLDKIKLLNLDSKVKYIESIPNTEIHAYYRAADCFVNFNHQEIFGMSILEAFYQKCPVVARHAPGPDTIVKDGETGFLCNTVDEMCDSILKIDPLMGIKGKERVEKHFSWNAASEAFLEDFA